MLLPYVLADVIANDFVEDVKAHILFALFAASV